MKLKEAINHIDEVIKTIECKECKNEHIQLKQWLIELQQRRENENNNYVFLQSLKDVGVMNTSRDKENKITVITSK